MKQWNVTLLFIAQCMVSGVSGLSTRFVKESVVWEFNIDLDIVIAQLLCLADTNAKDITKKL